MATVRNRVRAPGWCLVSYRYELRGLAIIYTHARPHAIVKYMNGCQASLLVRRSVGIPATAALGRQSRMLSAGQ